VPHHDGSPHDKHRSSGQRPVKLRSDQYIFQIFIKIYIFKNKLKNLIQTSKFKFSFWGLLMAIVLSNQQTMWRGLTKEHSRQVLFQLVQWFQRRIRTPDNFQVQRVITPYFWKWCVFAYFLCTVVLSTSEKIAYMYTFKIMFDTSVIQ
jgi:hypothetical protein